MSRSSRFFKWKPLLSIPKTEKKRNFTFGYHIPYRYKLTSKNMSSLLNCFSVIFVFIPRPSKKKPILNLTNRSDGTRNISNAKQLFTLISSMIFYSNIKNEANLSNMQISETNKNSWKLSNFTHCKRLFENLVHGHYIKGHLSRWKC